MEDRDLTCSRCGSEIVDYGQVGYDGPAREGKPDPASEECSPVMDWLLLCRRCAGDDCAA